MIALDLAAPAHLFGHCGAPHYGFALAGVRAGPVPTSTGFAVIADRGLAALRSADTIVVPGFEPGVSSSSGLGSAAVLRTHCARRLGTTPAAYRRTFRTR